jgi:hypothetical protein
MARVVSAAFTRGNGRRGSGAAWPVISGHDGRPLLVERRRNGDSTVNSSIDH